MNQLYYILKFINHLLSHEDNSVFKSL